VQWVWAPTASAFIAGIAGRYQPSQYDVVAVDGYSRTPTWRTPAQIFVAAHRFAMAQDKALLIGEVGCNEYPRVPMRKANWIQTAADMFHGWSDLQAVLWTNTGAKGYRYWLDSSRPSLTMFTMAGARFK